MVKTAFDRIIYGKPLINGYPTDELQILGMSGEFSPGDVASLQERVSLEPVAQPSVEGSQSFGIFEGPHEDFILAHAYNQTGDLNLPVYEYILLPDETLRLLAGNLAPLMLPVRQGAPAYTDANAVIEPLTLPELEPLTRAARMELFARFLEQCAQGDMQRMLTLLAAALDERRLLVRGFPGGADARVAFVQGLMTLLPPEFRSVLTFTTNLARAESAAKACIAFCDHETASSRWMAEWTTPIFPNADELHTPYTDLLASLWAGDAGAFIGELQALDASAAQHDLGGGHETDRLTAIADRHARDVRLLRDDTAAPEALIEALTGVGERSLSPEMTRRYAERLLLYALDARDAQAAQVVTVLMDADPALDQALYAVLNRELEERPDAVYALARARLREGVDERWQLRLQTAAMCSMRVVISEDDFDLLSNWFALISREPAKYRLGEVLRDGILAAQARVADHKLLGQLLLTLAAKRTPAVLDTLLDDQALLAALPNNFGSVLREHSGDPVLLLENHGREIFMVALARAAQRRRGELFTPQSIHEVWSSYLSGEAVGQLPAPYQADALVQTLVTSGADFLSDEALDALLAALLRDKQDELFHRFVQQLAGREVLSASLAAAVIHSQREQDDILDTISQLAGNRVLTAQQTADLYLAIIADKAWDEEALPLMEQLVRVLKQDSSVTISTEALWRLLEIAAHAKADSIARGAARRLFATIEQADDEAQVAERLQRIYAQLQWSESARHTMNDAWRELVRTQPLARLQRLSKALENHPRILDEARDITRTCLAVRKMLGSRSLVEFAHEINTAYNVLEALGEAFDPSARREVSFDRETIREELHARQDELAPTERKVLANNLKELAQLITEMAENRSKQLLRRDGNIERQLLSGEQVPQGAVDMMRWLSGYLSGVQPQENNGEG